MQASAIYPQSIDRKIIPIMPYSVKGKYRNLKSCIMAIAFAAYFGLPWLVWHGQARSGQPLLFDIANSRFYIFDLSIYPQDLMLLVGLMVMAATTLFISATLHGRIFCGFFCFQTIWTDAFRMIEQLIQGKAQARQRLRKQPWHKEKIFKIVTTHIVWFLLSLATAVTFALYFSEAPSLLSQIVHGQAAIPAYTTIIVLTLTTYAAAGVAKEDICRVACPYGKFQTVMQDTMTKTVIYDETRGERQKGRIAPTKALRVPSERKTQGYGDCIDCGYCVNVCPTGVDIRNGFHIDCISCGLCIDACDSVMHSMQLPTGLIAFSTLSQSTSGQSTSGQSISNQGTASIGTPAYKEKSVSKEFLSIHQLKRNGYLLFWMISVAFTFYQIQHLSPYNLNVEQLGQPLTIRLSSGDIKSRFLVHVSNKTDSLEHYQVTLNGLPESARLRNTEFSVPAGMSYTHYVDLILSEPDARKLSDFTMTISPTSTRNPGGTQHQSETVPLNYILKL